MFIRNCTQNCYVDEIHLQAQSKIPFLFTSLRYKGCLYKSIKYRSSCIFLRFKKVTIQGRRKPPAPPGWAGLTTPAIWLIRPWLFFLSEPACPGKGPGDWCWPWWTIPGPG